MPSPRRRSRDRRSRSRSPKRRQPQRRSRSRSTHRRHRSRSHSLKRSSRRSRTHSPYRRPVRRSGSRSRHRRSHSPKFRRSLPSPRGRPGHHSPSPRRRSSGRRSPSPRDRARERQLSRESPRDSSDQRQRYQEDDRRPRSPHSTLDSKRNKSASLRESPPRSIAALNLQHKSDYISVHVVPPLRRMTLSDRFQTAEQKDQGDIVIEDNIVIAIHRGPNYIQDSSPVEINRHYDPNSVVIVRGEDEGQYPLFDREEIKVFNFDAILEENVFEERRVISVIPTESQRSSKRQQSPKVIRRLPHQQKIKLDFKPDPRYEPLMKGVNNEDKEKTRIKRVQKNPNDLRHSLSKRKHDEDSFDARKKIEAKRVESDNGKKESDRVFSRLGGRSREQRRERSRDRRPTSTSGSSRDSRIRDRSDKGDGKSLPDFKNRPDKFQYEEWKENPEMIPRNPSYFEHDNREGERGFRGRGRGFRGRPPPRGRGFRGRGRGRGFGFRGGSYRREREPTWKHDLFDKLKDEEEEKPSSTTKN